MATLGVNMTSKEPEYGWADIKPTIRHKDPLFGYSERAYQLASRYVDEGRDQDDIDRMNWLGRELDGLARTDGECECRPDPRGDHLCRVCKAILELFHAEAE